MTDKTILLVEDNADDRDFTIRAFKKHNFPNPVAVACDEPRRSPCSSGTATAARTAPRSSCLT